MRGLATTTIIDLNRSLNRISRRLEAIELLVIELVRGEDQIMAISQELQDKIDAARAAIQAQTTVEDGNRTLLQHLTQMIADLKNLPGVTDPEVIAAIDNITAGIQANTDALTADVTANTPADDGNG